MTVLFYLDEPLWLCFTCLTTCSAGPLNLINSALCLYTVLKMCNPVLYLANQDFVLVFCLDCTCCLTKFTISLQQKCYAGLLIYNISISTAGTNLAIFIIFRYFPNIVMGVKFFHAKIQ